MQPEPPIRILIIDDHPENLLALEAVLEGLGHILVKARSGEEALKHLLHDEFAVILLDVQMPGMDGFETAGIIRSREKTRHTPIIFLTAISKSDVHITRGFAAGAIDYIFKPFDPDVLRAKVSAFVELFSKSQELREEIGLRASAEAEIRRLNRDLERRVIERTAALESVNQELEQEIAVRRRAEMERVRLLGRERTARAAAERAQQRLAFLGDASELLAGPVDDPVTLEQITAYAVPYLADFCTIDLVGDDGQLRRVATAHADPDKDELLRDLRHIPLPDWNGADLTARVLQTGETELHSEVTAPTGNSITEEDPYRLIAELGVHSYMAVPLLVRGRPIGVISFGTAESGRRYRDEDRALAEDLARRIAGALDNARLFRATQEAARRKDEFLAVLAHELRTPLSAVVNASQALAEIGHSDLRAQRFQVVAQRQAQHLSRLVEDLLDLSRVNTGTIELRQEPSELASSVQGAVEAVRPLIEQREHQLEIDLLPEPVWLLGDRTRLEQVLSNLLSNAAKYTDRGGKIWLTARRTGDMVDVRVRDTGRGIPPELLPRVFDLFTRAGQRHDGGVEGLGIGLALVKKLVELHGGSVSARSEGPQRGSEFIVSLPVLPESPPPRPIGFGGAGTAAPVCRRVLVVEDNADAAEALKDLLEMWGHEVSVASSGPAALEVAAHHRPDLVLCDIGLPGMDGFTVARELRQQPEMGDVQLVAMTGYGQAGDVARSREAGFDQHLIKPVDPARLRALLSEAGS